MEASVRGHGKHTQSLVLLGGNLRQRTEATQEVKREDENTKGGARVTWIRAAICEPISHFNRTVQRTAACQHKTVMNDKVEIVCLSPSLHDILGHVGECGRIFPDELHLWLPACRTLSATRAGLIISPDAFRASPDRKSRSAKFRFCSTIICIRQSACTSHPECCFLAKASSIIKS